jgi:glycosyltransferase involved in cell wall biosynthesis
MKIALDGTPLSQPYTGIGRYTRELAAHLPLVRPDAEIALPADPNVTGGGTLLERRWWSIGLPRHLRRIEAALFHGTDFAVPMLGATPSILTIHDLSPLRAKEWKMPATARRIARRLPGMIKRARVVIVPGERVGQEVAERFPAARPKIVVTPLAVSEAFHLPSDRCPLPKPDHPPCILFAGKREPRKNLPRLLRAMASARGLRDQVIVLCGPSGWEEPELRKAIAALGLQSRVWISGPCSDETLAGLYAHARLVVYPSLYEGFGLPVLEAMACGAPVLTSKNTACADLAGGAAYLVDPLNEEEIAAGMEAVLNDGELAATLRRKGLERARQFSWKRTAELTWQAYESVLSGR